MEFDKNKLIHNIKDIIDHGLWEEYDFDEIVSKGEIKEENNIIKIIHTDFCFIFDLTTYELIDAIINQKKSKRYE